MAQLSSSTPPRMPRRASEETTPVILLPILRTSQDLRGPSTTLVPDAMEVQSFRFPTPPRLKQLTDFLAMPYTQQEWKLVMGEVRTLYFKHNYRQCSARCIQLLESIEDLNRVHPLYSIYLSFYAATCIELTARSLHANSCEKIPLLQTASHYYKQAEINTGYATFSAAPTIMNAIRERGGLQSASDAASIRSSVNSVFSQTSSASSNIPPSPTSPEFPYNLQDREGEITPTMKHVHPSSSEEDLKPAPLKVRKKVSFTTAPGISSDSLLLLEPEQEASRSPSQSYQSSPRDTTERGSSTSNYLSSQYLDHYLAHLASLSEQLTYHKTVVSNHIESITAQRKARRSDTSQIFGGFSNGILSSSDFGGSDETKRADLQSRIQRLKERGWKRERFHGDRYKKLCDLALSELNIGD
ncbi:hypothetical protein PVAG01_09236 [Phlyctema vagabunda]|uniref:Uncharacterized protein n=1 Tax=Phlyctema vagabunda TaxID=108571 RepID=A0ABR4P6S4_9HELO